MTHLQKTRLIIIFNIGLSALFALCLYVHLPLAVFKSFFLVIMMALLYFNQEPVVLAVCGAFGLSYICIVAYMGYNFHTASNYVLWAAECSFYCGIYALAVLFCVWLKKLNEISKQHEMVIAGTTAGLWKWSDMNKDEQWWSPRYYKLLGFEENEIPASLKSFNGLVHPDDHEKARQALQDYIDGRTNVLEHEYRIRTKTGDYKWFLGSAEVSFEKNTRKPRQMVGSIVNIDHKKQYELALASQATLVALAPNAIITTDLDFNVLSWNTGAENLYQISAEEAIGKKIEDLFSSSYPYSTEAEVTEQFKANGYWRGEANQVTRKGHKVYVLASVQMVKDTTGEPKSIMTVNSDLSLLRINKELSSALKMVENSTQYLEQLAYVSSHDLKSPIVTLQGLLNHLAAVKAIVPGYEATFEMVREIVEQMKSTSISLSSILQLRKNLISREFASEKVSVAQVVKDVQEMLKLPIESSNAQIDVNIEKGLQLRVHHTFLKAILFNLLSNSIKFKHAERQPVISVTAVAEGANAIIRVADNGTGINLNRYSKKLFTIFTHFHEGVEGNGVGLHSVKMIVDFHKGDISMESEEGKGTAITIKLPVEPDEQN